MKPNALGFFLLILGELWCSGLARAASNSKTTPGIHSVTVAQIADTVITTRDVQISSIIDRWFLVSAKIEKNQIKKNKDAKDKNDRKDWILGEGTPVFQRQLSTLIAEFLVSYEAENFAVAQTSATEIQNLAQTMSEDLRGWSEWQSLEPSQAELVQDLTRHLRSKEFLKFKTESMGIQISDLDAKKYYDQNRSRFNDLPFEGFKESIKEFLIGRDIEAKMKDWFDVLRKKYKVKFLQLENK